MIDLLNPRHVTDMDESIDAFFETDKSSKIGQSSYFTFDDTSSWIFLGNHLPRVWFYLLHPEGDSAVVGIDAENFRFYQITYFHKL